MKWISIAEALSRGSRHGGASEERRDIETALAQAKLEMTQHNHDERLAFDRERLAVQAEAAEKAEKAKGENALAELTRKHALDEATRSSGLIDAAWAGVIQRESAWNDVFADTMRQLLVIDADTVRQERLRKLDHVLAMERLRLESELKASESDVPDETLEAWVREAMRQTGEN